MAPDSCIQQRRDVRGHALLLMVMLLAAAAMSFLLELLAGNSDQLRRRQATTDAIAEARQAIIAWSVTQGDLGRSDARPGNLPCPDRDDDGDDDGNCSAGGGTTIGRLPWRTLAIAEPRDGNGDRLWYVVDDAFRRANLKRAATNSDTVGMLTTLESSGAAANARNDRVAAVILAPGAPLPAQERGSAPVAAANFLEPAAGANNASTIGPFINGPVFDPDGKTLVNDRTLAIATSELFKAVEVRALAEANGALIRYAAAHGGHFPNAARHDSSFCLQSVTNVHAHDFCAAEATLCGGRVPEDELVPYAADWFNQNGWGRVMTYAVSRDSVIDGGSASCPSSVTVGGVARTYILISPGTPAADQKRPSAAAAAYVEDAANQVAWSRGTGAAMAFVPPSTNSNDQLRSGP